MPLQLFSPAKAVEGIFFWYEMQTLAIFWKH